MTTLQVTIIGGVVVLLLGAVGSRLKQWVTKSTKPKFSYEAGVSVRATLNRTKYIFNSAISLGGQLTHPWKVKDGSFTETEIQEALEAVSAIIDNRKFSKSIREISKQIREVYAAARKVKPVVAHSGMSEFAGNSNDRERDKLFASVQREAANEGIIAVSAALSHLNKLSRNL